MVYNTLVSCMELGCPIDAYVKHISKSTTTITFWVGLQHLSIYIMKCFFSVGIAFI
jgi:hypothetical protein